MRIGARSTLRLFAATLVIAVTALWVAHAVTPHPPAQQGPCVACQILSAPAVLSLPAASFVALEPLPFVPVRRGDAPVASPLRDLRPLRAPPGSALA